MILCRVIGSAVATVKDERLRGLTLLLVEEAGSDDGPAGRPFVAVDTIGAGPGELVLVTRGSGARELGGTRGTSVDAAVTGIVDSVEVHGRGADGGGR